MLLCAELCQKCFNICRIFNEESRDLKEPLHRFSSLIRQVTIILEARYCPSMVTIGITEDAMDILWICRVDRTATSIIQLSGIRIFTYRSVLFATKVFTDNEPSLSLLLIEKLKTRPLRFAPRDCFCNICYEIFATNK